jgi:hypothetical protein
MQCLQAQYDHGVPTSLALPGFYINVACYSCFLHKVTRAPRNFTFSKDDTYAKLECIMLEIQHMHTR